ncbi:MAG: 30S ribosomal protein S12 methylthiotransferase RimO [Candidatus Kapabacteria bacterium]|nr:30S ribosomal protein S12 methylthiotransferase RimO [Candidatus Kapabacteria bacterium]
MIKRKKVSLLTLGCAKNLVDSEQLLGAITKNGFDYSPNHKKSDFIIINTCGFIGPAKEENVNAILEAVELKRQGKTKNVIVMGCLSERYGEELKAQIKGIDHIFGVNSFDQVLKALEPNLRYELSGERQLLTPSHYAYIKIAEGCNRTCSFCAIPAIRGQFISRSFEEILAECKEMIKSGVKELILIAQDTTFYGVDLYGKSRTAELLEEIANLDSNVWVRLMYAYPAGFPENILNILNKYENICTYLDMPLQHISDNILQSMKRGLNADKTRKLLRKIRSTVPDICIRSTFIVGYPNESEEDFDLLYKFLEEEKIDRVGVFVYSHEDGTSAYSLPDNVPPKVKQKRFERLMELQNRISTDLNKQKIGKILNLIIDRIEDDHYVCRSQSDAPDIDCAVIVKINFNPNVSQNHQILKNGTFIRAKIIDSGEYDLIAELVK